MGAVPLGIHCLGRGTQFSPAIKHGSETAKVKVAARTSASIFITRPELVDSGRGSGWPNVRVVPRCRRREAPPRGHRSRRAVRQH